MSTEQRSGRSRYNGRRRNNNNNSRGGRYRGNRDASRNKKKTNPIIAFFSKLFGGGKKQSSVRPANDQRPPRPERAERDANTPSQNEEAQKPAVETPRLYIGNLSYETSESDLFDLFSQVGSVANVEVVRDARSNSKGFGFVEMSSLEIAKAASEKYHRTEFMGRQIVVAGAKK